MGCLDGLGVGSTGCKVGYTEGYLDNSRTDGSADGPSDVSGPALGYANGI